MTLLAQFAATGGGAANYVEDVFSTYLYTGNGATQNITNGIDLAGKGGLVWLKNRTGGAGPHNWYTTAIGSASYLDSSQTSGLATYQEALSSYNSNGFSLSSGAAGGNENTFNYASWTFREQSKFFDVVTYTGNGSTQAISHNLGSVPGCIIVKGTSGSGRNWAVWHRSLGSNNDYLWLESTAAKASSSSYWNNTAPTSTGFTVGSAGNTNEGSETYVAYIFAHDAGGFGLTGSDNVISCGSYTGNGTAGLAVTLGYESQWVLIKQSSAAGNDWIMYDQLRGMTDSSGRLLYANAATVEQAASYVIPNATGFTLNTASTAVNGSGSTYIYIAIRRGPMKVPTTGTSVYNGVNNNSGLINVGFVPDLALINTKAQWDRNPAMARLTGTGSLRTNATNAEETQTIYWDKTTGYFEQSATGGTPMSWFFGRAPGYFDVVCYTGTGSATTFSHNLTVVPELMIVKRRSAAADWSVYSSALGNNKYLSLNDTIASSTTATYWNNTTPTSSVFTVGTGNQTNGSGSTYVAYLFATCAGVSKVGSYTGTGTTQTINCGFTAGSRFVMIKRTDSTGDWYVWDSARGIIAGNDPYLLMNSVAAEVTGTDYVDTANSGFELSSTAPAAINANGGTYIFLAIA